MDTEELILLISRFGAQCADVMFWQREIAHRLSDARVVAAAKDCKQQSIVKREEMFAQIEAELKKLEAKK